MWVTKTPNTTKSKFTKWVRRYRALNLYVNRQKSRIAKTACRFGLKSKKRNNVLHTNFCLFVFQICQHSLWHSFSNDRFHKFFTQFLFYFSSFLFEFTLLFVTTVFTFSFNLVLLLVCFRRCAAPKAISFRRHNITVTIPIICINILSSLSRENCSWQQFLFHLSQSLIRNDIEIRIGSAENYLRSWT